MAVYDPEEKLQPNAKGTEGNTDEPVLGEIKRGAVEEGWDDDGHFWAEVKKEKKGVGSRAKGMFKKKGLVAGLGGGGIIGVMVGASIFSHLVAFQADGLLKGIESRTQRRLSASLDMRNKYLVRSYIKARMLDTDGTGDNTIFFSANKIDDKNPMSKWYRTMRTSKFETDLWEKDGIKFLAMRTPDGKFKTAKVMAADIPLTKELQDKYEKMLGKSFYDMDTSDISKLLTMVNDDEIYNFVSVETVSNKQGRKAIKQAVEDRGDTKSYQIFKRRHMRKDMQSLSGIKDWRLFETQRDKMLLKKIEIRNRLVNKMVDKSFSNSPGASNMLKCLFADGSCKSNTDPVSADSHGDLSGSEKLDTDANGAVIPDDNADKIPNLEGKVDKDGNPIKIDSSPLEGSVGTDIADATKEVLSADSADSKRGLSSKAAAKMEVSSVKQRVMFALIAKITKKNMNEIVEAAVRFEDPTRIWSWAVKISKLDGLINNAGKASKIVKLVTSARRSQVIGLFATFQIGASQMHTGQLSGEEAAAFMGTINGFGNSEGWSAINGNFNGGTAAAAAANGNLDKKTYCAQDPDDRTADQYAWLCDDQRPNSGGGAKELSDSYSNSIGRVIGPIAKVVRGINNSPPGKVVNWASNISGELVSKLSGPLIEPIMKNTGVGKSLTAIMGSAMMKIMNMLGAGPMYDGSQPGNVMANLLTVGGAESAEASTRSSGGIASTKQSLAYSSKLADEYEAKIKSKQSLYDRYASLSNIDSLASTALMSFHPADSIKGMFGNIGSLFSSFPRYLGNILTGRMFVKADVGAGAVADWAGVQKFDIPQTCITLDPLDPNYLDKATNADQISGQAKLKGSVLGWDTMRDGDAFWKTVYAVIGPENEEAAGKIYNCAILDARAQGSMGAPYGYTDDNGLSSGSSSSQTPTTQSAAKNQSVVLLGDSYSQGLDGAGIKKSLEDNGWSLTINAVCGRPLIGSKTFKMYCESNKANNGKDAYPGLAELDQSGTQSSIKAAGTVVIGLGTNDAGTSPGDFATAVGQTIDKVKALNPDVKIYWINLYNTASPDQLLKFNTQLTSLSASKGFTVIDWAAIGTNKYGNKEVHPNDGYKALLGLVVKTLGKAPAA